MIEKTQAIVLRYYPYSNTSRIVSWLTPGAGRMVTLVKGSQRPKSAFLGQYDLFYTCELLFYEKERDHLHLIRECSPLKTRDRFRRDWKAAATASYLAGLFGRVSPPDTPAAELFALLDGCLDALADSGSSRALLHWCELRLLGALGLAPRLEQCLQCGRDLLPRDRHAALACARGGLLCDRCARSARPEEGTISRTSVAPDVLATLGYWQRAGSPQAVLRHRAAAQHLDEVQVLLGQFLQYHLDLPLPGREAVFDVLDRVVGAKSA